MVKGNIKEVRGYTKEVKGNTKEVKGNTKEVKGNTKKAKGNTKEDRGNFKEDRGNIKEDRGNIKEVKEVNTMDHQGTGSSTRAWMGRSTPTTQCLTGQEQQEQQVDDSTCSVADRRSRARPDFPLTVISGRLRGRTGNGRMGL